MNGMHKMSALMCENDKYSVSVFNEFYILRLSLHEELFQYFNITLL